MMPEDESIGDITVVGDDPSPKTEKGKKKTVKQSSDSNVKRDMAFLQKKVAELEISVSEIQESVQKIDTSELEDLKQKVDSMESLSMVENAAAIEIQKALESFAPKTETAGIPEELDTKIKSLEEKISSLPDLSDIESKMQERPAAVDTSELSGLREEFQNKLNEINSALSNLEGRTDSSLQSKVLKEFESMKSESMINNSKVESVDSFVKELSKEVSELRPLVNRLGGKLESFEGIGDIESKLDELRDLVSTAQRIKESIQSIRELSSVVPRVDDIEHSLAEVRVAMDGLETAKAEMGSKWKTEYKKLVDETKRHIDNLEHERESVHKDQLDEMKNDMDDIRELIANFDGEIEKDHKIVKSLEEDMAALQGNQMALEGRLEKSDINKLNDELTSIDQLMQKQDELTATINKIEEKLSELEVKPEDPTAAMLDELVHRMVFLETRISALETTLSTKSSYPIIIE